MSELEEIIQKAKHMLKPQLICINKLASNCKIEISSDLFRFMNRSKPENIDEEIRTHLLNGNTGIDILYPHVLASRIENYPTLELYLVSHPTNDEYYICLDDHYYELGKDQQISYVQECMNKIESLFFDKLRTALQKMTKTRVIHRYFRTNKDINRQAAYHCILKDYKAACDLLEYHGIHNEIFLYTAIIIGVDIGSYMINAQIEAEYIRQLYFLLEILVYRTIDSKCIYLACNNYNPSNRLLKAVVEFNFYHFLSLQDGFLRRMTLSMYICGVAFRENGIYHLADDCIGLIDIERFPMQIQDLLRQIKKDITTKN